MHELEHARVPKDKEEAAHVNPHNPMLADRVGPDKFTTYYKYVTSRTEILAKSRDMVELSKQPNVPVCSEIEGYLGRVVARLIKLDPERKELIPELIKQYGLTEDVSDDA